MSASNESGGELQESQVKLFNRFVKSVAKKLNCDLDHVLGRIMEEWDPVLGDFIVESAKARGETTQEFRDRIKAVYELREEDKRKAVACSKTRHVSSRLPKPLYDYVFYTSKEANVSISTTLIKIVSDHKNKSYDSKRPMESSKPKHAYGESLRFQIYLGVLHRAQVTSEENIKRLYKEFPATPKEIRKREQLLGLLVRNAKSQSKLILRASIAAKIPIIDISEEMETKIRDYHRIGVLEPELDQLFAVVLGDRSLLKRGDGRCIV